MLYALVFHLSAGTITYSSSSLLGVFGTRCYAALHALIILALVNYGGQVGGSGHLEVGVPRGVLILRVPHSLVVWVFQGYDGVLNSAYFASLSGTNSSQSSHGF